MNKGITLVALIITIIIMLILAGVAISLITGEDSIFTKAELAKTKYEQAAQNEKNTVDKYLDIIAPIPNASKIQFTYSSSAWTNGTVKVDISTPEEGYAIEYSIDNGATWQNYTGSINVAKNNKNVLARLSQYGRVGGAATCTVSNIDTIPPATSNIVAGVPSTTSCLLTLQGADSTSTTDSGKSGIAKYELYVDNVLNRTITSTNSTENITLTFTNSSHICFLRVYDAAGNYKQSTNITVTKHVHSDACYAWTTVYGTYRWVGFASCGDSCTLDVYRCSRCGAEQNSYWAYEGQVHCSGTVRGALICGK